MRLADTAATAALGLALGPLLTPGDVITLAGDLGAGKTTLVRGVLRGLGFEGDVPSPSFPIVIPYATPETRLPLWHVDLYRLAHADEVEGLALEEALIDGALLIEWPVRLPAAGWPGALALTLEITANEERRLTANVPPSWEARWPYP